MVLKFKNKISTPAFDFVLINIHFRFKNLKFNDDNLNESTILNKIIKFYQLFYFSFHIY